MIGPTNYRASGGASAGARSFRSQKIPKPGHPESGVARIFSGVHFFRQKSRRPFLVVALKTQAVNAADCFTVRIKQRSDMVTFLKFSLHTIT